MSERRAKLFSPLARAGGILLLLVLVWLALRNAAIALFALAQPSFALALPPPAGEALAIEALSGRLEPERQQELAAAALARSPVSYWPILAAAEAASRAGDEERGAALLAEAVRRNSRQAETRGRLFQLYISQGRWSEAIDEGLAYSRLRDSMSDSVMESFLLLLGDLRGRAVLARKLQARADGTFPPWRERLVRLSTGRPGERALATLLSGPETAPAARDPAEISADGYVAWVGALPEEPLRYVRGVYDGEFRQLPGAPPFNWAFAAGAQVERGDPSAAGTLMARPSGARPAIMARQVLVLSPGTYRLAVEGAAANGAQAVWQIACLSGPRLVELPLPVGSEPGAAARTFAVPSDCSFQQLVLLSSPGGASRTGHISIRPGG